MTGRTHRSISATRSRSPRDQGTLPELFSTQMQKSAMFDTQAFSWRSSTPNMSHLHSKDRNNAAAGTRETSAPSLNNLHEIAADINNTLSAAIYNLRDDIHTISARVGEVEKMTAHHDASLCKFIKSLSLTPSTCENSTIIWKTWITVTDITT